MSALDRLGLSAPILQAPMAGVSTPAMAAAVSEAGGLGAIALGAGDAAAGRAAITEVRTRTQRAFNVNLFVHAEPIPDPERDRAWLAALAPSFAEFGVEPPTGLRTIYRSFAADPEMLAMLFETRPPAISFHFGLPPADTIAALRETGALLLATATSPAEARAVAAAGIDLVVAQGIEAGGHRGVFDPEAPDDALGTLALTRLLVREGALPVIAAGGITDGAGVAAALALGATAAQLGTAFVLCPESAADDGYRRAMRGEGAAHTRMTASVSGRPARSLASRFTALDTHGVRPAAYPRAYDAGKALHAAAKATGEHGFGAHWAGQGAPIARALPAGELMATLIRELDEARR